MMASSYCELKFNWKSQNSTNVTRYSFIDIESSDFDSILYENRINSHEESSSLQLFKQDSEENFILTIACGNPELSQINGISIDSESRTVEISNDGEGYIKSVHGKSLVSESNTKSSSNQTNFYVCSCSFEKPYTSLSIKFLSLGKKESFHIRSIGINLQQHDLESKSKTNGAFDIAKLKKEVEGMGDSVSDKALDFLATMEVFEQNKINTMGSFLGQNAMMPMQSPGNLGFASNGISSLMQSVLGENTMRELKDNVSKNGDGESTQNDIYSMLQSVCGKVAKTRHSTRPDKDISPEDTTVDKDDGTDERVVNKFPEDRGMVFEVMSQMLEDAKQEMTSEIHKIKNEVVSQMEQMKQEINGKLDNITALLEVLAKSQNSDHLENK